MGKPITAEQHNQARRATKARQQANRKAAAAGRVVSGPPIKGNSFTDRIRRERMLVLRKHNEDRLIAVVLTQGILVLTRPIYEGDSEGYDYGCMVFDRNVADVKRAAKARKTHFHWHTTDNGDFCIALPKRA